MKKAEVIDATVKLQLRAQLLTKLACQHKFYEANQVCAELAQEYDRLVYQLTRVQLEAPPCKPKE